MSKRTPENKPFRSIGMRMRDFGRSMMRQYADPDDHAPSKGAGDIPPAWKVDSERPLLWGESASPVSGAPSSGDDFLEPMDDMETYADMSVDDVLASLGDNNLPPSRQPRQQGTQPPVQRSAQPQNPPSSSQPTQRAAQQRASRPSAQSPLEQRLQNILSAHQERDAERDRKREEILRKASTEKPSDENAKPRRRGRAAVDYVQTSALLPPDERGQAPPSAPPKPQQKPSVQREQQTDDSVGGGEDEDSDPSLVDAYEHPPPETTAAPDPAIQRALMQDPAAGLAEDLDVYGDAEDFDEGDGWEADWLESEADRPVSADVEPDQAITSDQVIIDDSALADSAPSGDRQSVDASPSADVSPSANVSLPSDASAPKTTGTPSRPSQRSVQRKSESTSGDESRQSQSNTTERPSGRQARPENKRVQRQEAAPNTPSDRIDESSDLPAQTQTSRDKGNYRVDISDDDDAMSASQFADVNVDAGTDVDIQRQSAMDADALVSEDTPYSDSDAPFSDAPYDVSEDLASSSPIDTPSDSSPARIQRTADETVSDTSRDTSDDASPDMSIQRQTTDDDYGYEDASPISEGDFREDDDADAPIMPSQRASDMPASTLSDAPIQRMTDDEMGADEFGATSDEGYFEDTGGDDVPSPDAPSMSDTAPTAAPDAPIQRMTDDEMGADEFDAVSDEGYLEDTDGDDVPSPNAPSPDAPSMSDTAPTAAPDAPIQRTFDENPVDDDLYEEQYFDDAPASDYGDESIPDITESRSQPDVPAMTERPSKPQRGIQREFDADDDGSDHDVESVSDRIDRTPPNDIRRQAIEDARSYYESLADTSSDEASYDDVSYDDVSHGDDSYDEFSYDDAASSANTNAAYSATTDYDAAFADDYTGDWSDSGGDSAPDMGTPPQADTPSSTSRPSAPSIQRSSTSRTDDATVKPVRDRRVPSSDSSVQQGRWVQRTPEYDYEDGPAYADTGMPQDTPSATPSSIESSTMFGDYGPIYTDDAVDDGGVYDAPSYDAPSGGQMDVFQALSQAGMIAPDSAPTSAQRSSSTPSGEGRRLQRQAQAESNVQSESFDTDAVQYADQNAVRDAGQSATPDLYDAMVQAGMVRPNESAEHLQRLMSQTPYAPRNIAPENSLQRQALEAELSRLQDELSTERAERKRIERQSAERQNAERRTSESGSSSGKVPVTYASGPLSPSTGSIQREEEAPESVESSDDDGMDLEKLARDVFQRIKRRLRSERDRTIR